jgi:endonuclease/exonuclease/phosphatase family metal-dependent hydrolase
MQQATNGKKKTSAKLLVGFTVIVVFLFLVTCLIPLLNGNTFWFVSVLGLLFPVLLTLLVLCLVAWAVKKSKWFFVCILVLLLGSQQISVTFGFNFFQKKFSVTKSPQTLRVFTWNVSRWDEPNKKKRGGVSNRRLMWDLVKKQDADILFFQEFFEAYNSKDYESNLDELKKIGYPYTYFYPSSITVNGQYQYGMVISSKYPIKDTASFDFGKSLHSEGLIYADIQVGNRKVRVFSTHMESSRTDRYSYFGGGGGSGSMAKVKGFAGALKRAYEYRHYQAILVREKIKASPYPVILCGNLGDVPNSSSYFTVKGNLQDAFLKKGMGIGRTFRFVAPNLRLDYVMADKSIRVVQYSRPRIDYSDHYPIITDFEFH